MEKQKIRTAITKKKKTSGAITAVGEFPPADVESTITRLKNKYNIAYPPAENPSDIEASKDFIMPFGKHSGVKLKDLPPMYVGWLLYSCGERGYKQWSTVYSNLKLLVSQGIITIPNYQNPENKEEKVDHPKHYQGHKFEVIDIIEDFDLGFNLGNAIKYILRAGKKGLINEDLKKAVWYLEREIKGVRDGI